MKKLSTIAICLIIGLSSFGQKTTAPEGSEAYYLQLQKKANTTGWIMMGGGLAMIGTGSSLIKSSPLRSSAFGSGAFLILSGGALTLLSIVPFSKAGKYKRKAMEVAVVFQEITPLTKIGYARSSSFPSVQFTIALN